MGVDFGLLAGCAAFDMVLNKDGHAWPPVMSLKEFQGSKPSWMAHGLQVMVALDYITVTSCI